MNIKDIVDFYNKQNSNQAIIDDINSISLNNINQISKLKDKYKKYPIADLLTLKRIRGNALKRINNAENYIFTVKGVEQSSSSAVANFHSSLFYEDDVIADLCCGNGIDLIAIAKKVKKVFAIDLSDDALQCASFNSKVENLNNIVFLQEKAEEFNKRIDGVFIDPDRRPNERRVINGNDISPSFNEVLKLINKYKNVVVKLSPVFDYKSIELVDVKHTWMFVSEGKTLKEILLCTGKYSLESSRAAYILPDNVFLPNHQEIAVAPINEYIFEPDSSIIRAGLVQDIGHSIEYTLINKHIGLLTGKYPVKSIWGECFKVKEVFHYNKKNMNKFLKTHHVGQLIIKTRGFPETPQQVLNKFKLKGTRQELILIVRMDKEFLCLNIERI